MVPLSREAGRSPHAPAATPQAVMREALRQLKKFFVDSAILAFPVLQTGQVASFV
jgi:hypothetical protein